MAFNISYVYQAIDKFSGTASKIRRSVNSMGKQAAKTHFTMQKLGESLKNLATKAALIGAVVGGFSVREFIKFETALLGVAKTANIDVGRGLDSFGDKFTELSLKIPIAATELLNLGQAGAQMGVTGQKDILAFAETMGMLAKTTNVAGEEGAAQMARLIKVTGGSNSQIKNFASSLVSLGNTTAATEGEILQFATQLASSGALYGVSGTQAMGLAASMRALGVQTEVGSSVVGRSLGIINKSIRAGGGSLKYMSKLTGIAGKDLKEAFDKDAIGVLTKMGAGLEKMKDNGRDVADALSVLGLEGIRDIRVLGTLANNSALVADKIKQAGSAFEENTALQKEFDVQSKSLGNRLILLGNKSKKFGKLFTLAFKQPIDDSVKSMGRLIDGMNEMLEFEVNMRKSGEARDRIAFDTSMGFARARGLLIGSGAMEDIKSKLESNSIGVNKARSSINAGNQLNSVLEGNITVRAAQGTQVENINISTKGSMAANLGLSMGGAY